VGEKQIKITPQLIDTSTERAIWAPDPFVRATEDTLSLQAEIVEAIVSEIRVKIAPQEKTRLASSRIAQKKVNRQALEVYFKGKGILWMTPTRERWQSAYEYLQQAIAIDPGFAPAYYALVDYYSIGLMYAYIPFEDAVPKADAAIKKGRSLDPDSFEAHYARGVLSAIKWDLDVALRELERAVKLAPGAPDVRIYYWSFLEMLGRFDESIPEAKRGVEIDPSSFQCRVGLGNVYFNARRFDEAIAVLQEALQMDPNHPIVHIHLAHAYAMKNMRSEASIEASKSLELLSTSDIGNFHLLIAIAYAYIGRREDAQKLVDRYLRFREGMPIDAYTIAKVYSVLGEKDKAFEWLERAYKAHDYWMVWLKTDLPLDNLRSDPRFKEYLKKAGFEK